MVMEKKIGFGTIRFCEYEKGYGFIATEEEGHADIMFHRTVVEIERFSRYDPVYFEAEKTDKGWRATMMIPKREYVAYVANQVHRAPA